MNKMISLAVASLLFTCLASAQGPTKVPALKDSFAYFCPICDGDCDTVAFAKEGVCPHCGMTLIRQNLLERKVLLANYHKKMSICFYLQDGVELLDFAGPMEVFSYAGFRVFTVSKKKAPLVSQGILKIIPDYSIEDAPPSDILAFFGGNYQPVTADEAVIDWIRSRKAGTQYFFSVCTGTFILGKAGFLDGLTATTHFAAIESLRKALPLTRVLENERFVDNGNVITTAGVSAGIDGALHLVAKLKGDELAKEVAEYLEYDKWVPGQGLVLNKEGR
jgi:transcriptional regulator GlxA family with amidase domain